MGEPWFKHKPFFFFFFRGTKRCPFQFRICIPFLYILLWSISAHFFLSHSWCTLTLSHYGCRSNYIHHNCPPPSSLIFSHLLLPVVKTWSGAGCREIASWDLEFLLFKFTVILKFGHFLPLDYAVIFFYGVYLFLLFYVIFTRHIGRCTSKKMPFSSAKKLKKSSQNYHLWNPTYVQELYCIDLEMVHFSVNSEILFWF